MMPPCFAAHRQYKITENISTYTKIVENIRLQPYTNECELIHQ